MRDDARASPRFRAAEETSAGLRERDRVRFAGNRDIQGHDVPPPPPTSSLPLATGSLVRTGPDGRYKYGDNESSPVVRTRDARWGTPLNRDSRARAIRATTALAVLALGIMVAASLVPPARAAQLRS